jgi:hypothetical protein
MAENRRGECEPYGRASPTSTKAARLGNVDLIHVSNDLQSLRQQKEARTSERAFNVEWRD